MSKLKRVRKPAYYYHITVENLGKRVTLFPRRYGSNRDSVEPDTARICVAPNWINCLAAIPFDKNYDFNVYRTARRIRPFYPENVFDSRHTREKWVTEQCSFVLVGQLDLSEFDEQHVCNEHSSQNEARKAYRTFRRHARKQVKFITMGRH